MDELEWVIRMVDPELSEALLRITVRARGWEFEEEYPLARVRRPESTCQIQDDGTFSISGTSSSDEEGWHSMMSHMDGRTPDGRGAGASVSVTLDGSDGETVAIEYSASWDRADESGEAEGEVQGAVARVLDCSVGRWRGINGQHHK